MEVTTVKKKYSAFLLGISGVTGVGGSDQNGRMCIYVKNERIMHILQEIIARQIEGVPVDFMVMSRLKAQRKK